MESLAQNEIRRELVLCFVKSAESKLQMTAFFAIIVESLKVLPQNLPIQLLGSTSSGMRMGETNF